MPIDLNDPEAVRRACANMRGPPPGWYPGHPGDPSSHPENFGPESQSLVRRVGDPWPEGIPGGEEYEAWRATLSRASSRSDHSRGHQRSSSVASGATSRSSSRPGSSRSSSGVPSQAFSAGIDALNAAHSRSGRSTPSSFTESNVTYIDDASLVTVATTASELAAMSLEERPTSARGGAFMNPGMLPPASVPASAASQDTSRSSRTGSVAPSAATSASSSQYSSRSSRAGSAAPSTSSSQYSSRTSRAGSAAPSTSSSQYSSRTSRAGSVSAAPSTSSSHYSSRSSRAGSIAPSMLRGPESDAGSLWSGGGSSVAPSDSQSSYGGSSRHQRPIRPGVPSQANASPSGRHSTTGSVASGASYSSRNSGATSASRDSGRSGRSSRSGRSHSRSGSVSTGYQFSHAGMSSPSQGSSRSAASSGTIRPPPCDRERIARRASFESTATTNAGPAGNVFWPDLRRSLSSDAALLNFTVLCPVCATSMRGEESTGRNIGKILHCGHMVCFECVVRICANIDGSPDNPNARKPECPLCKVPLGRYPDCSKTCNNPGRIGYPMPRNMQEMSKLPLTMPEGGADPACCRVCRIKNIERQSKRLMRVILNDRKATARWTPAVDEEDEEQGDYTRVPELQNLLDVLADTARDHEISHKYTNLQSQLFSPPQHAVAMRKDRRGGSS